MSLVGHGGDLDFYHGTLRARDNGALIFGSVVISRDKYIEEEVRPWSYMKFPYFRSLGKEHGWYKVGPLAQVQNCDQISAPFAEHERKEFVDYAGGTPMHAPLAYHWTRMIRMLHAADDQGSAS